MIRQQPHTKMDMPQLFCSLHAVKQPKGQMCQGQMYPQNNDTMMSYGMKFGGKRNHKIKLSKNISETSKKSHFQKFHKSKDGQHACRNLHFPPL
jgi:hypothetical protein